MIGLIILALVGILAMIVELFVPAGGIIGLVGIGSIITAVVRAFQTQGNVAGSIFLMATFIAVPTVFILYFKFFPRSFMGKRLILFRNQSEAEGYTSHTEHAYGELKGKTGRAETNLRPAGTILVEGQRYTAVTKGEFVEKDSPIKIIQTEGNRIVVREGEKEWQ